MWFYTDDYILTACISLLKHVVGNESDPFSSTGRKFPHVPNSFVLYHVLLVNFLRLMLIMKKTFYIVLLLLDRIFLKELNLQSSTGFFLHILLARNL